MGDNKRLLTDNERDLDCARWMYEVIWKETPFIIAQKTNFTAWANTIRLMREINHLSYKQIHDLFTWTRRDSFWSATVLSPDSLRKHLPTIYRKVYAERGNNHSSVTGDDVSAALMVGRKR